MNPADFDSAAAGRLVQAPEGYYSFVPDPLPPRLNLDVVTVKQLSEADRALGELAGIGRMLPNPHLLIGPFLRREAVLSSRIEGTITTLQQLLLFEADPSQARSDELEVDNYVRAMEYGLNRLEELPVSLRLLRELHERLLRGVRGQDSPLGEFRRQQNAIGRPGQTPQQARFVPPPVQEMTKAMHDLEAYLHAPSDLPPLVRLALIHYQFETIHPFMDGNGRIGRLLVSLLLCEEGLLPQPLLYLSAFLEQNRDSYMELLLRASQTGAWQDWIRFFLTGVTEQSHDAIRRSQRLQDLWQQQRAKMQTARHSALALQLVDELFSYPAITIGAAQRLLGMSSHRGAQLIVERLEHEGILEEITGRPRDRIYLNQEIVNILQASEG